MGGALARGWAGTGKHRVTVTARSEETLARYAGITAISTSLDNVSAVRDADIIVLAVKPWLVESVCRQIAGAVDFGRLLILSVAANVFTGALREYLGNEQAKVFYVMPNIAAEYCESMTYLAAASVISY